MAIALSYPTPLWFVYKSFDEVLYGSKTLLLCLSSTDFSGYEEPGRSMMYTSTFLRLSGSTNEDRGPKTATTSVLFESAPDGGDYFAISVNNTTYYGEFSDGGWEGSVVFAHGAASGVNYGVPIIAAAIQSANIGVSATNVGSLLTLTHTTTGTGGNNDSGTNQLMFTTIASLSTDDNEGSFGGGQSPKISEFIATMDIGDTSSESHPIFKTNIDVFELCTHGDYHTAQVGTDPNDVTDDGEGFTTGIKYRVGGDNTWYFLNSVVGPSDNLEGANTFGDFDTLATLQMDIYSNSCDSGTCTDPNETHASAIYTLENNDFSNGDPGSGIISSSSGFSNLSEETNAEDESPGGTVMGDPHVSTFFGDKYDL